MNKLLPLVVTAAMLSGCAYDPGSSYVEPLTAPADATILASAITEFVSMRLPAARTAVILQATSDGQASNAVTPLLTDDLRRRGFALVADGTSGAHRVRYLVTPLDQGDLLRLSLDGGSTEASRFFVRNTAGALQAGGPFTIRTTEAER